MILGQNSHRSRVTTKNKKQKNRSSEPLHGVLNAYSCIQYTFQIPNFKKAKQMVITELDWTANLRTGRFPQ